MTVQSEDSTASAKPGRTNWRRPLLGMGGILLAGTALSSGITQYIAGRLNHHPALGSPVAAGIYPPWDWYVWSQQPWAAGVHSVFAIGYAAVGLSAVAFFVTALAVASRGRKPRRYDDVYGTARFATPKDIKESGFLNVVGVYIGGWTDPKGIVRYLRHDGSEHIAAIAPTRSGKGVGLVLPTLLSYPHSAVVYDEKGELYHLTGGWRSMLANNVVFRWQPGSPTDSCSFNFMDTVRLGTPYEISDAQNIAMMLCDPDGEGLKDHWAKTSYALISGVILHECYCAKAKGRIASLPDVADALSDPSRSADALYADMVDNEHLGKGKAHTFIAQEGRAQVNRDTKERASVHSTAVTAMQLFRDPIVMGNSRHSDFYVSDLMDHDRPVSLYIVVPGPDKVRLRSLVRLMVTTLVAGLTGVTIRYDADGKPVMPHKHRLLLMLDEFPSLGRLRIVEGAMATIAGFGIKAYLIMQDREQLIGAYGRNETILSNCHIKIVYAPNQFETAQWISGILGKQTLNIEDISESGKKSGSMSNSSRSIRQVAQDLLSPEQVMSLQGPKKVGDRIVSAGEMLIWAAGLKARIKGTQILYFTDPVFLARSRMPVPPGKPSIRNRGKEVFRV
jgi:type IV secretion system protein VirD4